MDNMKKLNNCTNDLHGVKHNALRVLNVGRSYYEYISIRDTAQEKINRALRLLKTAKPVVSVICILTLEKCF
jgi:hypothetical protein